jgi:hypothetical protein
MKTLECYEMNDRKVISHSTYLSIYILLRDNSQNYSTKAETARGKLRGNKNLQKSEPIIGTNVKEILYCSVH